MVGRSALETRTGRLATFSLLYLSEGIPFGFSAIALTAYMRQQGAGIAEVAGFTALLYGPWSFKWAWAPLIDLVRPARFGPRRFWIVLAQSLMIVTLGLVAFFDPKADIRLLAIFIAVHNVFAATQDVAIDALAVQVLPEHERGVANGFMFGSSYLGQAIGGSGALYVASAWGFNASYPFILSMLAMILFLVSMRLREPALAAGSAALSAGEGLARAFWGRLREFGRDLFQGFFRSGPGPLVGVPFALIPGGALAIGLALSSTIQVDLGMTEKQIADLNLMTTITAAAGCVIGGLVSDRIGHRRMLAVWYVLTTVPTFWLSGQFLGPEGIEGVTIQEYWRVAVLYNFFSGLVQGTAIAVFMGLSSPLVAGTQFTGYMALKNFVYSYSNIWQGQMAEALGYAAAFRLDAILGFTPLLFLPFLRPARRPAQDAPETIRGPLDETDPRPTG